MGTNILGMEKVNLDRLEKIGMQATDSHWVKACMGMHRPTINILQFSRIS